jgi:AraC-like DNA-binding protein
MAGYATVVLAGTFEEASFAGRFKVEPGDVLLHGRFDCHADRALSQRSLQILRLPWDDDALEGQFRTRDPDGLARLAERNPFLAMQQLRSELYPAPQRALHWADRLADAIRRDACVALQDWAEKEGLSPETVSRGFRSAFGVSPKLFRLESRARQAWNVLVRSDAPLTAIAHNLGFADLAHMSRSVCALTGFAPSVWRGALAQLAALSEPSGHSRVG